MNSSHPEHWTRMAGPTAWYAIWHPPSWKVEDASGVQSLTPEGGGGVLTLKSFWVPEDKEVAIEELLPLEQMFPERRHVRELKPLDVDATSVGYEGEVRLMRPVSWWRKLWKRDAWRRWRIWCLRKGHVCLVALFLQPEKPDPETETLAAMILNTLDFADPPADPPEVFTERVLELARKKFPLLSCEPLPDFQIRLGESQVNLFNFYRSYVHSPEQFEAIMLPALTTVVQVQGWGKEVMEPPLDQVRERIMPMLYPETVWKSKFPNFVGTEWIAGMVVLYVVDEAQAYWYIRDDLLEKWDLSADDLHELAIANLEEYFESSPMEFTLAGEDEDGPRLLLPVRPEAYNTARLLSSKFQEKLRELLGSEFAVGLPSRDFFVAVSLDSPEMVEQIRQRVTQDFEQMDHPLSRRLLLITGDGVCEYVEG